MERGITFFFFWKRKENSSITIEKIVSSKQHVRRASKLAATHEWPSHFDTFQIFTIQTLNFSCHLSPNSLIPCVWMHLVSIPRSRESIILMASFRSRSLPFASSRLVIQLFTNEFHDVLCMCICIRIFIFLQ